MATLIGETSSRMRACSRADGPVSAREGAWREDQNNCRRRAGPGRDTRRGSEGAGEEGQQGHE
eukprot:3534589-Pyramimonas_sp.AAC.1